MDLAAPADAPPPEDDLAPPPDSAMRDGGVGPSGLLGNGHGWCWHHPRPHGNGQAALYGSGPRDIWAVGGGGAITRYDGRSFTLTDSGATYNLTGVHGSGPTNVWAVGWEGTVVRYDGVRWTPVPFASYGNHLLGRVRRRAGLIYHHDGTRWSAVPSGTMANLERGWAAGTREVYAAGTLLRWDGMAWTGLPSGTQRNLYGVYAAGPGSAWTGVRDPPTCGC